MAVSKFRRKVEVVDALQYTGTNGSEMMAFCPGVQYNGSVLEWMRIPIPTNGWVYKFPTGGFGMLDDAQFNAMYDPGGPATAELPA
jgi:hypothetical protein